MVQLEDLLSLADFVSINCDLNPTSQHLINAKALAFIKPSAVIINTARGSIIDESALVKALTDKKIAGAALDVFSNEPLAKNGHGLSELFAMDNVIVLPHLTFFTRDAMDRLTVDTLARCDEILSDRPVLIKSRDPRLTSQTHGVTINGTD